MREMRFLSSRVSTATGIRGKGIKEMVPSAIQILMIHLFIYNCASPVPRIPRQFSGKVAGNLLPDTRLLHMAWRAELLASRLTLCLFLPFFYSSSFIGPRALPSYITALFIYKNIG